MSDPQAYTVTYLLVGTVLVMLAAFKARAWFAERILGLLLMTAASLFAAVGFSCAAPGVYEWIAHASGISNLATLIVYSSITACCACYLAMVLLWSPPSHRQTEPTADPTYARRAILRTLPPYVTVIALMAVLFFSADLPPGEQPLTFDVTFAARPAIFAFLLVYLAAFSAALWPMAHVCWQRANDVPEPILRGSLRSTAIGCATCACYAICKVIAMCGTALGSRTLDPVSITIGPACASLGGLVMATGWSYAAVRTRRQRRRDFHALERLWMTVTQADPGIVLTGPPSGSGWKFHALGRVSEIRDGQLALRPWTSQDVVEAARTLADAQGLAPSAREAVAAAAALRGALQALRAGDVPQRLCDQPPGIDVARHAERQHLVAVACHLNTPLVDRVLTETAEK
jgi:hypothetical protein